MATKLKKSKATLNSSNGGAVEELVDVKKAKNGKSHVDEHLNGNGVFRDVANHTLDINELLTILTEVKNGNFDVKMPIHNIGISGKI